MSDFAKATEAQALIDQSNWLLAIAAKNQRASADEALRVADREAALERGELLELRFSGARLKGGALPLDFLARLAEPLNNLLVKAAYFARNKSEAMYGAADDLTREIALSLVDVAPGSTRVFIQGNASPDMTGSAALVDGVEGILTLLSSSADFQQFYSHIDDIGERATEALRDTLRAVESEECSVEFTWHSSSKSSRTVSATHDRIVQMRALLEGLDEVQERTEHLEGRVLLLAVNGRIQLQLNDGKKATVRFRPRMQAQLVAGLTLNSFVGLDVVAKVVKDPISGEDVKRYSLTSLATPLLDAQAGFTDDPSSE